MSKISKNLNIEVENEDVNGEEGLYSIDNYVGQRICARRKLLQMSQKEMAEKLGITFQQVQKYEKGINRIGAGRLYSIAMILGVDIDYFYQEMDEKYANDIFYDNEFDNGFLREDEGELRIDPLYGAESVMLLKSFYGLPPKTRAYLLMMMTSFKDKDNLNGDI